MKRLISCMLVFCLLAGVLVGCAQKEAETGWPEHIAVSAGRPGTTSNIVATGIAALIEKYTGVSSTATSTTSNTINIRLTHFGKTEFGGGVGVYNDQAWKGVKRYEEDGELRNIRLVFMTYYTAPSITARVDSGIMYYDQLKGKRFAIPPRPSAFDTLLDVAAATHSIKVEDWVEVPIKSINDQTAALIEGKVDAFMASGMHPTPAHTDVFNKIPCRLVGPRPEFQEAWAKGMAEEGHGTFLVKGGTYKGLDEDVWCPSSEMCIIANKDVPEELVYQVVKGILENPDDLLAIHEKATRPAIEGPARLGAGCPYHPGAIKYYKEVGLWTEELEAETQRYIKME
ncbi:TAXI family TRAP transporter solute-binding subunit [Chloroflexota bacterium]